VNKKIIPIFCLLISSFSYSADKVEYVEFFEQYQRLSAEYDVAITDMYADDAKVIGARKKSDGSEESMTIDGVRWKSIIMGSLERAKQVGDRSEYSEIDVEVDGELEQARISATRYSVFNCFTDNRFYMVVKTTANGQLKIVEQFMESPIKSGCENSEPDLSEFLQSTVEMINKQLPAAIDAETHLIKTSAEDSKLIYHYVLVNYTSETLTSEEATAKLRPLVIQQTCSSPNLRPILDQDGSLSYIYRGSDAVQIVKLDVDLSACSG